MPASNKRTYASTNSDEETPSPKKPRTSSLKLLPPQPTPVDHDEKSDAEDGQSDSNEDASGDTEVEEENSDNEGEDGQLNEEDEQEGEQEDHGENPVARPSSKPTPAALICHCGHPAEMKQSLNGLPHNRGEWFGKCASGSCQYWKWANGSGQQRFDDAMDAQFNMCSDAESEGGDSDQQDDSGINPSGYENHLDEPPEGEMRARIREMRRIERREQRSERRQQKGRNSEEDVDSDSEDDEEDFQQ